MKKFDRVCIIDDDDILVYGMKSMMAEVDFCHRLMVFSNGQEAIAAMGDLINRKEMLPNIIFLDIDMPIMDGWEFLEDFLKIPSSQRDHVTIYITSSSIDPRDFEKCRKYGGIISNYILKPITQSHLEAVLEDITV